MCVMVLVSCYVYMRDGVCERWYDGVCVCVRGGMMMVCVCEE